MFFVVRLNDSFNFPLELIKYIVIKQAVSMVMDDQSLNVLTGDSGSV